MNLAELESKTIDELQDLAKELDISGYSRLKKQELAFRILQAENARIKEAIEQAWDGEGLATFLRYLRDYIEAHPAG